MRSVAGFIRGPDSGRRPGGTPRRCHGLRPWARRRRAACGRRASAPFFIRKRVQLAAMLLFRVAAGGRIRAAGPAALRAAATGFARGPAAGGRPAALPHPKPPPQKQKRTRPGGEGAPFFGYRVCGSRRNLACKKWRYSGWSAACRYSSRTVRRTQSSSSSVISS